MNITVLNILTLKRSTKLLQSVGCGYHTNIIFVCFLIINITLNASSYIILHISGMRGENLFNPSMFAEPLFSRPRPHLRSFKHSCVKPSLTMTCLGCCASISRQVSSTFISRCRVIIEFVKRNNLAESRLVWFLSLGTLSRKWSQRKSQLFSAYVNYV